MKIHSKILVVVAGFMTNILLAQDSFSIENVSLFDGEKVSKNVTVKVVDGLISSVSTEKISDDTTIVNGEGKFLMPAMTNAHVHVWSPNSLKDAAKAGVLNVMDMHGVERYQGMMKHFKDSTDFASYFIAGAAATAPEGHGTQFGFPTPTLSTPKEAVKFVEDRLSAGVDYIKIIVEPWKATLKEATVSALISAAHQKEKIAVSHISRAEDAAMVIKNDIDGLVHIWWDVIMEEETMSELTKEKSFFVVPTVLTSILAIELMQKNSPEAKFLNKKQLQSEVKRLFDSGVPILAGTDPPNANINYGTDLYKELLLFSEAGIPNIEVLKTATSNSAIAFGLLDRGYLKKGYRADMILIDGNPIVRMEDIDRIHTIWKKGKKVKRD